MKDIAKKANTQSILDRFDLKAQKKFGQNFINDLNTIKKIVSQTSIDYNTCVIEIGPGIGALTEQLALVAKHVVCYEIDERLKEVLEYTLCDFDNIEIRFQDFLTVDLYQVVEDLKEVYDHVCIVANLPYYITTDILEYIISSNARIDSIHAMVQKEVALKLTDKNFCSPLTFMIDCIGEVRVCMQVSRYVFNPQPRVDSAIIEVNKKREYVVELNEILEAAFKQKRKTIFNNLKSIFQDRTLEILQLCGIEENKRAEQLTIDDYLKLTQFL